MTVSELKLIHTGNARPTYYLLLPLIVRKTLASQTKRGYVNDFCFVPVKYQFQYFSQKRQFFLYFCTQKNIIQNKNKII